MKVKDLMIGDYLKWNGEPYRVIQVTGVIGDSFMLENGMDDVGEPIPLTPEILEEIGFEKEYGAAWNIYRHTAKKWFVLCKKEFGFTLHIAESEFRIDYIHELQNFLRLCGVEKEIEL